MYTVPTVLYRIVYVPPPTQAKSGNSWAQQGEHTAARIRKPDAGPGPLMRKGAASGGVMRISTMTQHSAATMEFRMGI